jgi:hypothetical protein
VPGYQARDLGKQEEIMTLMERTGSALYWAVALMMIMSEGGPGTRYRVVFPLGLLGSVIVFDPEVTA